MYIEGTYTCILHILIGSKRDMLDSFIFIAITGEINVDVQVFNIHNSANNNNSVRQSRYYPFNDCLVMV